jgi:hypothetical protein
MRLASFLLSTLALAGAVVKAQDVCAWSAPLEIYKGKLEMQHYKDSEAGTYTMRLTYTQGSAWVSIGVNHDGSFHMAPSSAVIGRIEYAEDGTLCEGEENLLIPIAFLALWSLMHFAHRDCVSPSCA